jgi:hypothetical protein
MSAQVYEVHERDTVGATLNRVQLIAMIAGIVGVIICVLGLVLAWDQFFQSYLFAFLFWMQFTLGGFGVVMLHHLTGGRWGFAIRRLLEAAMMTLPLMAILFVPIVLGLPSLYVWARPEEVQGNAILEYKQPWLNPTFFIVRAVLYFVIWLVVAFLFRRFSLRQDRTGEIALTARMRILARFGIVSFVLAVTFAMFDWGMSIEPMWYSSIYGAIFIAGQALTAIAFAVILSRLLVDRTSLAEVIDADRLNDLGNLMLGFTIVFTYVSFSQFLIIWSANIPEEASWFVHRLNGGWELIALLVVLFHFFVPLLVLLQKPIKRRTTTLSALALAILVIHLVNVWWYILPTYRPENLYVHWLDLAAPLAIGGLWIAWFVWQLKGRSLLPRQDPRFQEAFSHDHH